MYLIKFWECGISVSLYYMLWLYLKLIFIKKLVIIMLCLSLTLITVLSES